MNKNNINTINENINIDNDVTRYWWMTEEILNKEKKKYLEEIDSSYLSMNITFDVIKYKYEVLDRDISELTINQKIFLRQNENIDLITQVSLLKLKYNDLILYFLLKNKNLNSILLKYLDTKRISKFDFYLKVKLVSDVNVNKNIINTLLETEDNIILYHNAIQNNIFNKEEKRNLALKSRNII